MIGRFALRAAAVKPKPHLSRPSGKTRGLFDAVIVISAKEFGGSERHTVQWVNHMVASGRRVAMVQCGPYLYSPALLADHPGLEIVRCQLPVRRLSRADSRDWRRMFEGLPARCAVFVKSWFYAGDPRFLQSLRDSYATVFHIEHSLPEPLPPRSRRWHFGIVPGIGLWWYRDVWLRYRISRMADRFIVVSEEQRRRLALDGFVPEDRIVVCPNGADLVHWRRNTTAGARFRRALDIPDDAYVFACVGRLAGLKRFDVAIRAFARFSERNQIQSVLCIIGNGDEREPLAALAKQLGVDSRVRFLDAMEDLRPAYSATDTVLLPSRIESCGLVLLEGMASGCRVIAAAAGGVPEVLTETAAGDLLSSWDPDDWSIAMLRHAATSESERRKAAEQVREFVARTRDISVCMADLTRVLDETGRLRHERTVALGATAN